MQKIPEKCWQIAAGDTDRNYADICLRHNVVIMGPSYCDNWNLERSGQDKSPEQILIDDNWSSRKITNLKKFINDIEVGDLVILRLGKSEVHGIGIVRSEYEYNDLFSDIDGWDLAHSHRVEWTWAKPDRSPKTFPNALKWGDTTQELERNDKTAELFDWILSEEVPEPLDRNLPELGNGGDKLQPIDISRKLYDYGLGTNSLSNLESRLQDIGSLAAWYQNYFNEPSETETVAHLVVPLLLSLGWTPQRIALEYYQAGFGSADLALYQNGNRKEYQPIALIEAKKFGYSCLSAEAQVRSYAKDLEHLRRLIVTDGIRYGVFVKGNGDDQFPTEPSAYLNLTDLRDNYPVYGECKGADEAMLYLSAAWSYQFQHPADPVKKS